MRPTMAPMTSTRLRVPLVPVRMASDTVDIAVARSSLYLLVRWGPPLVLAVAQLFGLMPVRGIGQSQPMAFRWRSFRVLGTVVYLVLNTAFAVLTFRQIKRLGITPQNIVGLVFYVVCCGCSMLFLLLARRWPHLLAVWSQTEAVFLRHPYAATGHIGGGWRLSTKVRTTAALFFVLALLEHTLSHVSNVTEVVMVVRDCPISSADIWQTYMHQHNQQIFDVLPFKMWIAAVAVYAHFAFTVAWNYMDIFIMTISIGLAERFRQLDQRLTELRSRGTLSDADWHEMRMHYVQLCELLETVDAHLAPVILLSCANNLYFICVQLLNIFNKLPHFLNAVYFWYSLLYLIGRSACMVLCAATVHDASRRPLEHIRHTHTDAWSTEAERFRGQIDVEPIALSGMRFFYLTRKLLLGMAGTIVTYELVLLQIDASSKNISLTSATTAATLRPPDKCVL